jgi:two-component SAPR family response regulator
MDKILIVIVESDNQARFLIGKNIEYTLQKEGLPANVLFLDRTESALEFFTTSGELEAYEKIVLFVEVHMPSMDGIEFVQKFQLLEALVKKTSIVLISSDLNVRARTNIDDLKNVEFLLKPIKQEDFLRLLTK